jgi:hypothetical protein
MALILVFDYRRILDAIENDPRAEQIDGDYRKSVKILASMDSERSAERAE